MTTNSVYKFPSFTQFMPHEKRILKRFRSWLRFCYAKTTIRSQIHTFETFLNQNALWQPLFNEEPYRCNTLLRKYCDNRFSAEERLRMICHNFILAENYFGKSLCQKLVSEQQILLANLTEDLQVYLNINRIDPFEGFFSLNILTTEKERVYDASFTFLPPNKILIASIQGPKGEDAAQLVKTATKSLFGVRPMFMLVNIFKMLAQDLQLDLEGIAHKNQGKYRFNDHTKLLFNYDEFWSENQGVLNADGYWHLPLDIERKPLEEIQSKKRSMYKKRYAMLDETAQQITRFFKENV